MPHITSPTSALMMRCARCVFSHGASQEASSANPKNHTADALPYPIGLAHDCQQVEHLPTEHWDIPLPEILTPLCSWAWHEPK